MGLHDGKFISVQFARFEQDSVGDANLANVALTILAKLADTGLTAVLLPGTDFKWRTIDERCPRSRRRSGERRLDHA
jgi:hypothetical protein